MRLRTRSAFASLFFSAVVIAQEPPKPAVVPAAAVEAKPATPFDPYRNYDKLPALTREIVFSAQRGMEWLGRDGIHQPHGRFVPGIDPALGKATDDDHFVKQAIAAHALARAARLTGDEKHAVRASHTVLTLLAETPRDPMTGIRKCSLPTNQCNPVMAAAYLCLAVFELPSPSDEMRQAGEELAAYLRTVMEPDGTITVGTASGVFETECLPRCPGIALHAIALSQRNAPAAWKTQALTAGLAKCRQAFRATPDLAAVPSVCSAACEAAMTTKDAAAADFVAEMVDWLVKLQYAGADRKTAGWRGGFPAAADVDTLPTVSTALVSVALADACRMMRKSERPDVARYERCRESLTRSLQFLATLQYGEENAQHFAAHFRPAVVGAFHPSAKDGVLRTTDTAGAVSALTQYLIAGADR